MLAITDTGALAARSAGPRTSRDLQLAFEQLPVAIFMCEYAPEDNATTITFHNSRLAEILGVNSERLVLDPSCILEVIDREDFQALRQAMREAGRSGSGCKRELRIRRPDALQWVEVRASVFMNDAGHYVASGCFYDISARKAQENAAKRPHATGIEWLPASEMLPLGLITLAADPELTIVDWNLAAERMFGYTRAEAIGKSALELIVLAEDWDFVRATVRPAADESLARGGHACNVCKDRRRIACRWFSMPVLDDSGVFVKTIVMVQDITEQVRNEDQVRLWASVIEQSTDAIVICDADQRIVLVNRAFERITQFTQADSIGKTPRILQSGLQSSDFYAQMWRSVTSVGHWHGEIWNRRKNGELFAEWLALSAVRDVSGVLTHYIGIFSDITQRKKTEQRIQHLAHFDALTDLPNRTLLIDRVGQLMTASNRNRRQFALFFLDLDRFKNINDSMGHEAGDELLKVISRRLVKLLRTTDTVARMGGDEFVLLLPEIDGVGGAAVVAEAVLRSINTPLTLLNQEISVSASIGICLFPNDAGDVSEMIRNADAAMYRAKSAGRNSYQFYTRDMNALALEKLATENALRHALQRQEFVLHYQPQVCATTGALKAVEALIRWHRPEVGFVMPGQFIPIAEERGLIAAIGQWTLHEAARQAAEWDRLGMPPVPIAVNISATQFHQQGFIERLTDILASYGLASNRIELEITETVILQDCERTVALLQRLHALGFALSIDDFGTGCSSLNYLRRFPIRKIKIDRSFVSEMLTDRGAAGIVRGIIGLAKSLDMQVIAEGVETAAQLESLRASQCEFVQGFLVSKAIPAAELATLVTTGVLQYDQR
jgi:diguanylate cyclase (GGDEF)-like protein/PAS domain S-box-containing protein